MKKCIAAILAILYLSTSIGATVHLHFCMGKLAAWTLHDRSNQDDALCGMKKVAAAQRCSIGNKDCCRDEYRQIKAEKDQKSDSYSLEILKQVFSTGLLPGHPGASLPVESVAVMLPAVNGPPVTISVPVFLRNCNFRI